MIKDLAKHALVIWSYTGTLGEDRWMVGTYRPEYAERLHTFFKKETELSKYFLPSVSSKESQTFSARVLTTDQDTILQVVTSLADLNHLTWEIA